MFGIKNLFSLFSSPKNPPKIEQTPDELLKQQQAENLETVLATLTSKDASGLRDILTQKRLSRDGKRDLVCEAIDSDDTDLFTIVLETIWRNNPNDTLYWIPPCDFLTYNLLFEKTLLECAIDKNKPKIALLLASDSRTADETIGNALDVVRKRNIMPEVHAALANRVASLKREEAVSLEQEALQFTPI